LNENKTGQYLSLEEGRTLVRLARQAVTTFLRDRSRIQPPDLTEKLSRKSGVFVTLNTVSPHELRGCIGFPYPEASLAEATINAAIYAATDDPRFSQVRTKEFETNITIEVTVLTPPVTLYSKEPANLPGMIQVGKHGLIVERRGRSGLLLPQVATEWGWDSTEFLTNSCLKANLPPDSWLLTDTTVKIFSGEIYEETAPGGEIKKKAVDE